MTITLLQARRVLGVIDAGLTRGLGERVPGEMCIEAAVCFALGLPHGDDPACVSRALRQFKIGLNDRQWSSNEARAKGLRRLGIAQLGSDVIDDAVFKRLLATKIIGRIVPIALRAAASRAKEPHKTTLLDAALLCETTPTKESALKAKRAAYDAAAAADAAADAAAAYAYAAADAAAAAAAADAADAAAAYAAADAKQTARDRVLTIAAELAVEVLREMGAPGIALMDELIPSAEVRP